MCYHPPANVFLVTRHPFCAGTFQEGDTMQILILFVVLAMIPGLLQAQATCKELQPTLHDYRVAEHGESYLAGRLALRSFSDSEEVCEKLRQDASVYMCRFRQAKATAESSARLAKNMLAHVRNRMSLNPRQVVGGEAANRRVIRESAETARRAQSRLAAARLEMERARTPYRATVEVLKRNGCWHSYKGRKDPILDEVAIKADREGVRELGNAWNGILDILKSTGVL